MADIGFVAPEKTKLRFALEPARNAVTSLLLISQDVSGVGEWVERVAAQLSAEELEANEQLLGSASLLLQGEDWPSFLAWVDDLAARDPYDLLYLELSEIIHHANEYLGGLADESITPERLIEDRDAYLAFYRMICEYKGCAFDEAEHEAEHALLSDPVARLARMVDHLRMMWDTYLADEWAHNLPMLEDSVAAFESLDLSGLSTAEAIRRIIDRDEPQAWGGWRDNLDEIIFVPSAHIGPYLLMVDHTETRAWVVFGARIPAGASVQSPSLNRSELLVRLNALADDTRLRILSMLANEGEQETKQIQDALDLSKSAASRHLRQLTASGYVIVRQHEKTNYYRLNPTRIHDTWHALKRYLQLG